MYKSYPTIYVNKMLRFLKRKKISIPYKYSISEIEHLTYLNGGGTSISRELFSQIMKIK